MTDRVVPLRMQRLAVALVAAAFTVAAALGVQAARSDAGMSMAATSGDATHWG